jgi:SAM-dependent methyltransferase
MTDARQAVAGVFDRSAATYDAVGVEFFSAVGARLLEPVGLRPGDRVLDMGCGRGATLFPAAAAVGPTGGVHGIDLAPMMVELTRADARARGLGQVTVEVGDAQEPDLAPASYDVVLSSLAVFFLPDPGAGLRAWRAATVDGGRLALSTFASREDPRWSWLEVVFPSRDPSATAPGDDEQAEEDTGPFSSSPRLHDLLQSTGWRDASSVEQEHVVRFDGPDQWVRWSWSHGMRAYWERLDESGRAAAEALARERLLGMQASPEGLTMRMLVRYTTAYAG